MTTTSRPRKPWRVILSGSQGFISETDHTSEAKAYEQLCTALRDPASVASEAMVMQWSDGRWWHFETLHADNIPAS